jgi:FkbM family methyltransferase
MKTQIVNFINYLTIFLALLGYKSSKRVDHFERLGTPYGGWWVPKELRETANSFKNRRILVSAGIGNDVSFDLEMLKLNFELIALDPLPRCIEYAQKKIPAASSRLIMPKGLWDQTGSAKFFSPKNKSHDSYSITNIQNVQGSDFEDYQTIDVFELFVSEPRLTSVDNYVYLKMDIEGAELNVLNRITEKNIRVNVLAVEFDVLSLIPVADLGRRFRKVKECRRVLKNLKATGYVFAFNEKYNFFWEGKL